MYGYRYPQQQQQLQLQRSASISSSSSTNTVPRTYRCTGNYGLGQTQSSSWQSSTQPPITETDLLKYKDLNMDLKELNNLFKDFAQKTKSRNNNIRQLSKKKNSTQTNRNSIATRYTEASKNFVQNFKKILSTKIRDKVLQRLDKLLKKTKEKRINKVACALSALLAVLASCGSTGPTTPESLITKYKEKVKGSAYAVNGYDAAAEFLYDILIQKTTSVQDFIDKQSTHQKKLGEILRTTIQELPLCP